MPKDLWWVPFAAGLRDGINPCLLMTAALILLGLLWVKRTEINKNWFVLLIAVIVLSTFVFNCGLLDKIVLNKFFQITAKCIYVVLAIIFAFYGLRFLNQWFLLIKGKEIKADSRIQLKLPTAALVVLIVLAGFLLSMAASLWPINYYIMAISVYMLLPGQEITLGSLILLYTVISLWMLYVVVWFSFLETANQRLFKMVSAAVLLSASLGVVSILL